MRVDLRFAGGLVLDPAEGVAQPRDLLIAGDTIAALVEPGTPADAARTIDASNKLVLPGLVNLHAHSHLTLARGLVPMVNLEGHLHAAPWTLAGRSQADRNLSTRLTAVEMIRRGCTTCFDMVAEPPRPTVEGMQAIADAHMAVGTRAVIAPAVFDGLFWDTYPGVREALPAAAAAAVAVVPHDPEAVARLLDTLLASQAYPTDRVRYAVAPTIPIQCSDGFLSRLGEIAAARDLPFHTHVAKSRAQVVLARERYGTSLVGHLDGLGLLGPRFTAAHAIWLEPDEIRLLADRGAAVALNPVANLALGCGVPPLLALWRAGVTIALGTDGCTATTGTVSMPEAIRTSLLLSRITEADPRRWLPPLEALRFATVGGATALGLADRIGRLAPGYLADVVTVDLTDVAYRPCHDPVVQFALGETGTGITDVYVGGRPVMVDRRIVTIDEPALVAAAQARATALLEDAAPVRALFDAAAPAVERAVLGTLTRPGPTARALF
jgi:guanine deaminase